MECQYTVYSSPTAVNAAEKRASALLYPDSILQQYLQMPVMNEQILELARQITKPANSIAQAVTLVQTHLLSHYRYNLDVPSLQSSHPLEDFLLTRKTGYCEHYATAMVIMLRSVGIPARLVTGFLATEWNEFGGYYTVRQRDAHAWVEVYFPQSGWITMDPTPPAPEAIGASWWQSANSAMDSIRLKWDRLFVHYSAHDQFTVVQGIREGGEAVRAGLSETLSALSAQGAAIVGRLVTSLTPSGIPHQAVVLLLALAAAYGVMTALRRFRKRPLQNSVLSTQQQTVITLYTNMLHCCAQRGLPKPVSTTSLEFLDHIQARWGEAWPFAHALTQLYTRVRFGQAPLTDEDLRIAETHLRRLRLLRRSTTDSPQPSR